jgi:hypothetical protein
MWFVFHLLRLAVPAGLTSCSLVHRSLRSCILMKTILAGAIIVLFASATSAHTQKCVLELEVRGVPPSGISAEVRTDAVHPSVVIPAVDSAVVHLPCVPKGNPIVIWIIVSGNSETPVSFTSNGSQSAILEWVGGGAVIKQKPAVVWASSAEALNIYRNGNSEGTTTLVRAIPAGERQQFEWRRADDTLVCRTAATLDWNQRRTYRCNPRTGRVSVE